MLILALDLGLRTGWAFGEAGQRPSSGSDKITVAASLRWLDEMLRSGERPRLIVVEDVLPLRAYKRLGTAEASVYDALRRQGIVEGVCWYWGIQRRAANVLAVRKHFTGKRSWGDRAAGKGAVIKRCRQLGYVPADCSDEDRCDACAIWDWASATIGRRAPEVLTLFGGA